jgi:hypothetical protein
MFNQNQESLDIQLNFVLKLNVITWPYTSYRNKRDLSGLHYDSSLFVANIRDMICC